MHEPLVPIGEIVTTHGLSGWLKLNVFNRETSALTPGAAVSLKRNNSEASAQEIEASRAHRNQWLLKFKGIDSIDAATEWIGALLCVDAAALANLQPGQYYHYQVIGFEVFSTTGERIGTIASTLPTPGGELYVVQGAVREHLIPAVKELIDKVDFSARKVIVDPPDGLLDL
jgi:16S rRNA processing protein RimM